jgi:hypothetical protein
MGWGSILGDLVGQFGGNSNIGKLGGQLFDWYNANDNLNQALDKNSGLSQQMSQIIAQQMNAGQYDESLRNDLVTRVNEYEKAIRDAYGQLGPRDIITPDEVKGYSDQLMASKMNDLDRYAKMVSSQSTAGDIERGMDASMIAPKRLADVFTANIAPAYQAARDTSWSDAVSRLTNQNDLTTKNRSDILSEVNNVYGQPINALALGFGKGGSGIWNQLGNQIGNQQGNLNIDGLNSAVGKTLQGIDQTVKGTNLSTLLAGSSDVDHRYDRFNGVL